MEDAPPSHQPEVEDAAEDAPDPAVLTQMDEEDEETQRVKIVNTLASHVAVTD